jgi:hypothetical protein
MRRRSRTVSQAFPPWIGESVSGTPYGLIGFLWLSLVCMLSTNGEPVCASNLVVKSGFVLLHLRAALLRVRGVVWLVEHADAVLRQ